MQVFTLYLEITLTLAAIFALCLILTCFRRSPMYRPLLLAASVVYVATLLFFTFVYGGRDGLTGIQLRVAFPLVKAAMNRTLGLYTSRSLLNLLLFFPLGYLLPQLAALRSNERLPMRWWQATLYGFGTTLLIETCQMTFHRGVFELDDLVKNTLGTLLGWCIWRLLDTMTHRKP